MSAQIHQPMAKPESAAVEEPRHNILDPWCEKHNEILHYEDPDEVCRPCSDGNRGTWGLM